jgi:hypothetical protein
LFSLIAPLLLSGLTNPQDQPPVTPPDVAPPKPPKPQFFAGVVVEADATHVKVSRDLVGRSPETRVFALDEKTKISKGGIKLKARVTVRYDHFPERDLALEIQVRGFGHNPKTT